MKVEIEKVSETQEDDYLVGCPLADLLLVVLFAGVPVPARACLAAIAGFVPQPASRRCPPKAGCNCLT